MRQQDPAAPSVRARPVVVAGVLGLLCALTALLLVVAALLLERACRTPDPDA